MASLMSNVIFLENHTHLAIFLHESALVHKKTMTHFIIYIYFLIEQFMS